MVNGPSVEVVVYVLVAGAIPFLFTTLFVNALSVAICKVNPFPDPLPFVVQSYPHALLQPLPVSVNDQFTRTYRA